MTTATLQAIGALCVAVANFPRGPRRGWHRYRPWDLLKARRIARGLDEGDAVLDVGCGTGHTLAMLGLFRAIRPQGVDLQIMSEQFPEVPISTYDGRTLGFPDRSFDVTLFCYVMHHLSPVDAAGLFQQAVRVTRRRIYLIEDSLPRFGRLYRLRNRLHRIEAGLRYRDTHPAYEIPPDESMFKTHEGWAAWLRDQPGVGDVTVESLADVSQHDHHTLIDVTLSR